MSPRIGFVSLGCPKNLVDSERVLSQLRAEGYEVEEDHLVARTAGDAPETDGLVYIEGDWEIDPGDSMEVEIAGSDKHDLWAQPVDIEED